MACQALQAEEDWQILRMCIWTQWLEMTGYSLPNGND